MGECLLFALLFLLVVAVVEASARSMEYLSAVIAAGSKDGLSVTEAALTRVAIGDTLTIWHHGPNLRRVARRSPIGNPVSSAPDRSSFAPD